MKKMVKVAVTILTLILIVSFSSCQKSCAKKSTEAEKYESSLSKTAGGAVATFDGKEITDSELQKEIQSQLFSLEERVYQMKVDALNEMFKKRLLEDEAKKRNLPVEKLVEEEVNKQAAVSKAELDDFYNKFQSRLEGTEKEKRERLEEILKKRKGREVEEKFVETLKAGHKLEILLEPPLPPRVEVSKDDDPETGPSNAPVTIVEFSDFECPFCKRGEETVKKVKEKYGDKVNVVFRDFPLSFHKNAVPAAEAANCAFEQGKFWEYQTKLFDNSDKLEKSNLVKFAEELQLNMKKFNSCVDERKYKNEVEKDVKDGEKLGIRGTPNFYVNGRLISGSRPVDYFEKIINAELKGK